MSHDHSSLQFGGKELAGPGPGAQLAITSLAVSRDYLVINLPRDTFVLASSTLWFGRRAALSLISASCLRQRSVADGHYCLYTQQDRLLEKYGAMASMLVPLLYVFIVFGGLWVFSTLYKRHINSTSPFRCCLRVPFLTRVPQRK